MASGRRPNYSWGMVTKKDDARQVTQAAPVKSADRHKVRAAVEKIRHRDAELLKRLAR